MVVRGLCVSRPFRVAQALFSQMNLWVIGALVNSLYATKQCEIISISLGMKGVQSPQEVSSPC